MREYTNCVLSIKIELLKSLSMPYHPRPSPGRPRPRAAPAPCQLSEIFDFKLNSLISQLNLKMNFFYTEYFPDSIAILSLMSTLILPPSLTTLPRSPTCLEYYLFFKKIRETHVFANTFSKVPVLVAWSPMVLLPGIVVALCVLALVAFFQK